MISWRRGLVLVLPLVLVALGLYVWTSNWKLQRANAVVQSLGGMERCDDISGFNLALAERLEGEPSFESASKKLCQLPDAEVLEKNEYYIRCMVPLGPPLVSDLFGDGLQIEISNDQGKPSVLVLDEKPILR